MLISITATDWSYNVDLSQGPGTVTVNYVEGDNFRPSEDIINQATTGDRIRINVLIDGTERLLGDFVVDEYTVRETDDSVTATLQGRDAKALLLESFPTQPKTYHGIAVNSDCSFSMTLTSGNQTIAVSTCVGALNDLITRAGFTPLVNVDNYVLGQDFVHTTNISYGDAIVQLLAPHRVTEKHYADAFLTQANQIIVWQRTFGSPFNADQPIILEYEDLIDREVERQRPVQPTSVQVYGANYNCFEDEPPPTPGSFGFDSPIMGWPWYIPYTYTLVQEVKHPTHDFLLYTITREWNFGTNGQIQSAVHTKEYDSLPLFNKYGDFYGTYAHERTETITETWKYDGPWGAVSRKTGEKALNDSTLHYEVDSTNTVVPTIQKQVNQIISRFTTEFTYDVNVLAQLRQEANPITKLTVDEQADERFTSPDGALEYRYGTVPQPPPITAPLVTRKMTNADYKNVGGQIVRSEIVEQFDEKGAVVVQELQSDEMSINRDPFTVTITPRGKRSVNRQFKCQSGVDEASSKHNFSYIGSDEACCVFRSRIIDGNAAWPVIGRFSLLPDPNIIEGMKVQINNAPARWGVKTFYIVGRAFERTVDGMIMRLTGMAFL